jgi:rhamnulokinase
LLRGREDELRAQSTLAPLARAAVVSASRAFAAVDLGAESGRVVLGRLDGRSLALEVAHRFPNRTVRLPDGLHWNLLSLFSDTLEGLARAAALERLSGIGVDAWGVDYALLDGSSRVLGLPFHYRDARTQGMVERVHERVGRDELYSITGIQTMAINTIFQLMADADRPAMRVTERIGLVPDLFGLWLTGELANEVTAASTTGLLDARSGGWAREIVARLGYPAGPFSGEPVEPGTLLGSVLRHHGDVALEAAGVPVWTVAGHDTASAFVATPMRSPHAAVLSSGTWSLLGAEVAAPRLGADAAALNLTNESGVDGTIRLLRNVMGLWLLQECRRCWHASGAASDYVELHALAAAARPDVALFDPDTDGLLAPGDMPSRIEALCRAHGQAAPDGAGETVRSILLSLACKYRLVLERLQLVVGHRFDVIHVVGGGARNELLCQMTADLTKLPVIAGPEEATALGNLLVQARAAGELGGSLVELRDLAAASTTTVAFEPADGADGDDVYSRFLAVTGLGEVHPQPVVSL